MTPRRRPVPVLAAVAVLPLLAAGCAHDRLDPSFAMTYNAVFAAQHTPHPGRDARPLNGEESARLARKYYESLGGAEKDGAGGAGSTSSAPMLTGLGGGSGSGQPNPFALKGR